MYVDVEMIEGVKKMMNNFGKTIKKIELKDDQVGA